MNNRRNLKENLTISNKQRFGIRKFSIGVASVMLGTTLYFMGGVGPSIVHADSVDQPVQTQTSKDINSAQASSDAILAQQDSDQNQSQVSSVQNDEKTTNDQTAVKSSQQATNASAAKSNTQDSKKAVSDTNETKSVANKAQISDQLATATSDKSSQQVAKTDTKNSNNTLDIKQNKQRLAGNVKLNALTDNKAQTDTQTNSNYSVTDNYPEGLMNYLPSDFNNKQEYAFEWLRNKNNNNIILTTNRTGDGEVYVYQDRTKVGTLVQNSWGYGYPIGTVYNDEYAGIVHSEDYPLNIIYSSHAKDVDNAYYSTISFFVPHKITQTVTYYDSNGKVIDSLTHTQDGLTGQSYTTGLPSGSDYVRPGEYLDNITNNGSGLISEFHDGYECTKNYHDGVSVTFTENDSEEIGAMDYVVYDNGNEVKSGTLTYGDSVEYDKYAYNGWNWYKSHSYTIVNPYVPQTTNIVYQYKKLGNVVNTDPQGNTTETPYTNDPNDPTKVESINVPSIPGYTTQVNGKPVSDKTIMPADPGKDTYITYIADPQKASVTYVDDKTGKTLKTDSLTGVTNAKSGYTTKAAIDTYTGLGYTLVSDDTNGSEVVFDNDDAEDQAFTVHLSHGTIIVTPENPGNPGKPINPHDPNGPKWPKGTDKDSLSKDVTEHITYTGLETPAEVTHVLHFTGSGYLDKVTGKWTDKDGNELEDQSLDKALEWTADDKDSFDAVISPSEEGYYVDHVEVKVGDQLLNKGTAEYSAYTDGKDVKAIDGIAHNHADITITVHYKKLYYAGDTETQTVTRTIKYLDKKTDEEIPSDVIGDNPVKQTATLSRTKIVDHDGNLIGYGTVIEDGKSYTIDNNWHVDENKWVGLASPDLSKYGYTDPVFENGTSAKEVAKVQVDGDTKDQTVNIYYDHTTTTVTPENPGNPGKPINPHDPNGPKYPDGTDEYQVKRTGTQTIHYVGASDKTPADNKQTFIFTREITFDNVTGNIISVTPWNVQSHTFGNVDTPVIPGYHADKVVAGGATVTPDDLNRVITVTYAPDGNPGDQGDTPTPEPTPEPEPTPNPTPDDQPDSEISSDEHFENVKAKDKLNKTNPKKVDAYKKQRKIIKTKIAKQGHTEIIKTKIAKQGHTEIAEPIEDKVTRENNVKVVSDPVENKAAEPKLPQTGEADNSIIGLLGMLLASFAAMFGFDSLHSHDKKHKN